MENFPFEKTLVGGRIIEIKRTCDLIMFSFELVNGKKLFLHTQCFLRLFDSDKLLLTSSNLYTPSKSFKKKLFKKFDWSKLGNTLFDDIISLNKERLLSSSIRNIAFHNKDLQIIFDNKMILELLINVTEYDDKDYSENYRIFSEEKSKEHFII